MNMQFEVNKGIEKSVEFKGLKAQYLMIFAVGLLLTFLVVVVMYMANADAFLCFVVGGALATITVYGTFHLNKKYGKSGLMKLMARMAMPKFIILRKPVYKLIKK